MPIQQTVKPTSHRRIYSPCFIARLSHQPLVGCSKRFSAQTVLCITSLYPLRRVSRMRARLTIPGCVQITPKRAWSFLCMGMICQIRPPDRKNILHARHFRPARRSPAVMDSTLTRLCLPGKTRMPLIRVFSTMMSSQWVIRICCFITRWHLQIPSRSTLSSTRRWIRNCRSLRCRLTLSPWKMPFIPICSILSCSLFPVSRVRSLLFRWNVENCHQYMNI